MIVDKSVFERFAPSAIDVESDIFDYLSPFFERAYGSLVVDLLGVDVGDKIKDWITNNRNGSVAETEEEVLSDGVYVRGACMSVICENVFSFVVNKALFLAIPNLDLVLTNNGFGVVNTQLIAPASKDRVASLRLACFNAFCLAFDELLVSLPGNSITSGILESKAWLRRTDSLVWTLEHFCSLCAGAKHDDFGDFFNNRNVCDIVMSRIDRIISVKQREDFINFLRGVKPELMVKDDEFVFDDKVMIRAINLLKTCFSELYSAMKENKEPFSYAGEELLNYMHENFLYFPNYTISKQHYVRHAKKFTTTKKDGCFMF